MRSGLRLALLKPAAIPVTHQIPYFHCCRCWNVFCVLFLLSCFRFLLHGSVVQWLIGALRVKGCPGLVEELWCTGYRLCPRLQGVKKTFRK